jgi:uncharacterized membrane protein
MTGDNLVLVAGTYPDAGDAAADFKTLKDAQTSGEYKVVGAVVASRDEQGKVTVDEHGGAEVGGGATLGAVGGLVVGLFAPPLLLATAIGAGIGAAIGALVKRHEEKEMGVELDEYLPVGTSAIIAVVDDTYADNVESALVKADKKVNKAIDSGDVDKLKKALADAGHNVDDAITS